MLSNILIRQASAPINPLAAYFLASLLPSLPEAEAGIRISDRCADLIQRATTAMVKHHGRPLAIPAHLEVVARREARRSL
jgi:hypothetical protein